MPDVARFFNIDPLAEKYPTWAPYVFSGNRVIDARELEGLEPHSIHKSYKEAGENFGKQYNNMSIRMNGEIGTRFYKGVNSDGTTYYSYTTPISAGPNSGAVNSNLAEDPPKGTVQVGISHTHGRADEIEYGIGQDAPSNYGPQMGDIAESVKASKENPNFEGDMVTTPGGYLFIYGPGTQNGTNDRKMKPDSTSMPKDPNSKKNPTNKNTERITPQVLPTGETEDNYIQDNLK